LRNPECVCLCVCLYVCVICREREPCTVFGSAPSFKPALFLLCQATQLPGRPARPTHARRAPVGEPVAGRPPSRPRPKGHDTARMAWNISIPLAAQTVVKRLSKFNRCHLSEPSVPVQEFNPIACPPTQPIGFFARRGLNPRRRSHGWPVCTAVSGLTH